MATRTGPRHWGRSLIALAIMLGGCGGEARDEGVVPAPATKPTPVTTTRWTPMVGDTWQWQLNGTINTNYPVKVYDIDLVDAPQSTIDSLHTAGRHVICYFSAGSSEDFRHDYGSFLASDKGKKLKGFDGENWIDVRSANIRRIMLARLDLAVKKKCDAVEPDNVDGYSNDTGFNLTARDQLDFNNFLAREAHARGLSVGLKNDLDQIAQLVDQFEFAVNEQCHEFGECAKVQPFITQGKPVFNAEYLTKYRTNASGARAQMCATARSDQLRTLVLPLKLDDRFRYSCD